LCDYSLLNWMLLMFWWLFGARYYDSLHCICEVVTIYVFIQDGLLAMQDNSLVCIVAAVIFNNFFPHCLEQCLKKAWTVIFTCRPLGTVLKFLWLESLTKKCVFQWQINVFKLFALTEHIVWMQQKIKITLW
jgi:hypothetical protein